MPSNLRKQWQVELDEKFEVESIIVESGNWDEYKSYVKNENAVVIVSYNFASRRKSEFTKVLGASVFLMRLIDYVMFIKMDLRWPVIFMS